MNRTGEIDYDTALRCSECGEPFAQYQIRDGKDGSPVMEREELTCPNDHRGVINYNYLGHRSQSWGVRWTA